MNQKGFTLLEVTLFMAISSALAVVALAGLAPRLRNVRFTDSVRTVESNVKRNLSVAENGSNQVNSLQRCMLQSSPGFYGYKLQISGAIVADAGGTSDQCVLNGRLVVFGPTTITYYLIASSREKMDFQADKTACQATSDFVKLLCYGPTILTSANPVTVNYTNGVGNSYPYSFGDLSKAAQAFGVLQDPNTGQVYSFTYRDTPQTSGNPFLKPAANIISNDTSSTAKACLTLGSRNAIIQMTAGSGSTPQIKFDQGCT